MITQQDINRYYVVEDILNELAVILKCQPKEVLAKLQVLHTRLAEIDKETERFKIALEKSIVAVKAFKEKSNAKV